MSEETTRRALFAAAVGAAVVVVSEESEAANIKISAFPNAATNMGSGDRLNGLQGGANVNFSQAQILTGTHGISGSSGGTITIKGGVGDAYGNGGALNLYSGDGGSLDGTRGGDVNIKGGYGSYGGSHTGGSGGNISIRGGVTNYFGTGGAIHIVAGGSHNYTGGLLYLKAGDTSGGSNNGGPLTLLSGSGTINGGPCSITAGSGDTYGGGCGLYAGNSDHTTGHGGTVRMYAGAGHLGGHVYFKGGQAFNGGAGGDLYFAPGAGVPNGNIKFHNLPTIDPTVSDAVFSNHKVLMQSGVTNANGAYTLAGIGAKTITIVNGIITSIA